MSTRVNQPSTKARVLALAKKKRVIRASEATAAGGTRALLSRLIESGELIRLARGLYALPETDLSIHTALALAQRRVSKGTICLLSALQFHNLTTQVPGEVWMMIDVKAWLPSLDYPPIRVVRASGKALTYGVKTHEIDKQHVRITTRVKTVADCFKYRSTVGLDVALEALREYRRERGDLDALWRAAKVDRVSTVMRPYIEAMA